MEPGRNLLELTMRELLQGGGGLSAASRLGANGREPAGAIVLVIGADETAEVLDAVNRQLTIWQTDKKPSRYVDEKGRIVSVRAVRGARSEYYAFARDPDSGSLEMLRGKDLPAGADTFADAQAMLDAFASRKDWAAVPDPNMVGECLALVMESPPDVGLISEWSDIERLQAAQWAMMTHVRASDNPSVKVPPVPNVLFNFVRGKAGGA